MGNDGQAMGLCDVEPCKSCSECTPETEIGQKGMKVMKDSPLSDECLLVQDDFTLNMIFFLKLTVD